MRNPDVSCFVSVNPDWWRPAFLLCFLSALRLPFRRSEPSVSTKQLAESKIRNETQYGKLRNATSNNIKYENIQISDLQSRGFWTGFLCSVRWGRWVRTAFSAETEKTSEMSAPSKKPKNIANNLNTERNQRNLAVWRLSKVLVLFTSTTVFS